MISSTHFSELTSPRAGELLQHSATVVLLLPVGAVEPHGPHAPLGTDTLISATLCARAADALRSDTHVRAVVLPPIEYGVARYGAAFPGAVSISEATLRALVTDICAAARDQGFEHVVIVNSHFEPEHVAVLRDAAGAAGAGLLDVTRRNLAEQLTEEFRSGAAHAGRYETSLVLAARPELIDSERMSRLPSLLVNMPAAIAAGQTDFVAMGMEQAYCGAPAEASAAEGEATFATLTVMLVQLIRRQAGR